jgi:hypothetical protein
MVMFTMGTEVFREGIPLNKILNQFLGKIRGYQLKPV